MLARPHCDSSTQIAVLVMVDRAFLVCSGDQCHCVAHKTAADKENSRLRMKGNSRFQIMNFRAKPRLSLSVEDKPSEGVDCGPLMGGYVPSLKPLNVDDF